MLYKSIYWSIPMPPDQWIELYKMGETNMKSRQNINKDIRFSLLL